MIKGLILSGGAGTRLRPLTHTSAKQLIPVANKPVIFYGIEALVEAGITEIGIIIAPHTGEEIKQCVGDGSKFGAKITYILQEEPKGLAHAVLTAKSFIGKDSFVMYLGDNILRDGIKPLVEDFKSINPDSMILLTEVENPSEYGIAEVKENKVTQLVEKPAEPKSNLALVGVYIFNHKIFVQAEKLEPSNRGELEITEAIQGLIDDNEEVEVRVVDGWWKDTGSVSEMLEANKLVLESIGLHIKGNIQDSSVDANVVIPYGSQIINSVIEGPVIVGQNTIIENSYIGPNTTIGDNVSIKNSKAEYSIILSGCEIVNIESKISDSLIAKNVKLYGNPKKEKISFVLGENSRVEV